MDDRRSNGDPAELRPRNRAEDRLARSGADVLDGGAVYVPPRLTALLLATLRQAARNGRLDPEMLQLAQVCRRAAAEYRATQVRLHELERRAAARPVVAIAQTGPPSDAEVTVTGVADRTGLTGQRVRQLAGSGQLPGRKAAGVWYFTRAAVDEFVQRRGADGH